MRIDNSDSINKSISMNNSGTSYSSGSKNNISAIDADKTNNVQNISKEWSQSNTKSISQLNEYDKSNMPVSERVVIEAIQKANKAISGGNRRFEFSIHEATNEIVVKVFDSTTDELIKEIPNEKILDMVAKICEMAGILVDERR
ncbi:MAG: flagellar protein FlaG [Ruminiclostridium sp.]